MAYNFPSSRRKVQQPVALQVDVLPAPISGIDGRLNLSSNSPMNAVYAINLVPSEYGLRSRLGYREYATNLETAPDVGGGVRSLVPYTGAAGGGTNKLFAMTNEGIWDATDPTDTPTLALAFLDTTGDAGWGNYSHYTTEAGLELVFYADEVNGLLKYTPSTDIWAPVTDITGVDPLDVVFVVVHKERLWLVERDTPHAWYLPIAAHSGAAVKFSFGAKFRHGGDLVALYNWSIDGGDGVDDYLVAVGRGGDILPYRGEDPSSAVSWSGVGVFFVGRLPAGRRCGAEDGGDLHLLCEGGLITLSDLLAGNAERVEGESRDLKIARFIRVDMNTLDDDRGWEVRLNPNDGSLLINTPVRREVDYIQYTYNYAVRGWGTWDKVPAQCFEPWQGAMMYGTADNRVMRMDVTTDEQNLAGDAGRPIDFSTLQNFTNAGTPGIYKYPKFMRPNFLGRTDVTVTTKYLYDYDISANLSSPLAPSAVAISDWDAGLWDQAIWQSRDLSNQTVTRGAWGRGRVVALALRGQCNTRTVLVSTDVMWLPGGPF